jgi:hypothetical protein
MAELRMSAVAHYITAEPFSAGAPEVTRRLFGRSWLDARCRPEIVAFPFQIVALL